MNNSSIHHAAISLDQLMAGFELPAADLMKLALVKITGLQQDSRKVQRGDCFIAVTGLETDGRKYINAAIKAGAVAIIQQTEQQVISLEWQQLPIISMPNLLQRISPLAANFYAQPSRQLDLIGITGTNGKTSCAQLLAQLLSRLQTPAAMIGTMGYGVVDKSGGCELNDTGMTTPDAVRSQAIVHELVERGSKAAVLEVSSHALLQGRVAALDFTQAIFTNLSRDHLDYHGDMVSYGEAKAKLFAFDTLQSAIINADDEFGQQILQRLANSDTKVYSYGVVDSDADVSLQNIEFLADGIRANLHSPWGQAPIHSKLLGGFNLYNLLAVVTAVCAKGFDFNAVVAQIEKLKPVAGRMQQVSVEANSKKKITVVVDYAHTPDALNKALLALKQHCGGQLWCIFGCGGDRDKGKRPLMMAEALSLADHIMITSDNPRGEDPQAIINDITDELTAELAEAKSSGRFITQQLDRGQAIAAVIASAGVGDTVLIAGKGHEAYQQIGDVKLPFDDVLVAEKILAGEVN